MNLLFYSNIIFTSKLFSHAYNKTEVAMNNDEMLKQIKNIIYDGEEIELTEKIIGAAIEVHRELGCGLKEEIYEVALEWELNQLGQKVLRQVPCLVIYKGMVFSENDDHPKRIDMLVEDKIILELKAVGRNDPIFCAQCLTYLRMKKLHVGLVLNFGLPTLKDGIKHVVNNPDPNNKI